MTGGDQPRHAITLGTLGTRSAPREREPESTAVRLGRVRGRAGKRQRRAKRRARPVPRPQRHRAFPPTDGQHRGVTGSNPVGVVVIARPRVRPRVVLGRGEPRQLLHLGGARGKPAGGGPVDVCDGQSAALMSDGDVVHRRGAHGQREDRGTVQRSENAGGSLAGASGGGGAQAPRAHLAGSVAGDEEIRREGGGGDRAHLGGVAAQDAEASTRGGVPQTEVLIRGAGDEEVRRPGTAREAQRGDAIGVADEGARVSRVGGERAEKNHRVARGVGVELAVRAAPVREVGSIPVGGGGDRHGVVRSSVRHRRGGRGCAARVRRGWAPPRFTTETAFAGTRRETARSYRARTRTMCMRSRCVSRWASRSNRSSVRPRCARAGLGRPDETKSDIIISPPAELRQSARALDLPPWAEGESSSGGGGGGAGAGRGRVGLTGLFGNTRLLLNEHVDYELRARARARPRGERHLAAHHRPRARAPPPMPGAHHPSLHWLLHLQHL